MVAGYSHDGCQRSTVTACHLNVRSSPGTAHNILTVLDTGDQITLSYRAALIVLIVAATLIGLAWDNARTAAPAGVPAPETSQALWEA